MSAAGPPWRRLSGPSTTASLLSMMGVTSLQGFSAIRERIGRPLALGLAVGVLGAGVLSGCGGASKTSSTISPQAIEHEEHQEEAAVLKGEEAQELQKQRELLSVLESKKREEAAAEAAKRTLSAANAKAKRREQQAEKAAQHKEKEAAEKQKAAEKKLAEQRKTSPAVKKPATKKPKTPPLPKESIATPPTVTVPNGG